MSSSAGRFKRDDLLVVLNVPVLIVLNIFLETMIGSMVVGIMASRSCPVFSWMTSFSVWTLGFVPVVTFDCILAFGFFGVVRALALIVTNDVVFRGRLSRLESKQAGTCETAPGSRVRQEARKVRLEDGDDLSREKDMRNRLGLPFVCLACEAEQG